eukprot:COSAG05_NODE_1682_length_4285_cov_33.861682_9_plen_164_part_00
MNLMSQSHRDQDLKIKAYENGTTTDSKNRETSHLSADGSVQLLLPFHLLLPPRPHLRQLIPQRRLLTSGRSRKLGALSGQGAVVLRLLRLRLIAEYAQGSATRAAQYRCNGHGELVSCKDARNTPSTYTIMRACYRDRKRAADLHAGGVPGGDVVDAAAVRVC